MLTTTVLYVLVLKGSPFCFDKSGRCFLSSSKKKDGVFFSIHDLRNRYGCSSNCVRHWQLKLGFPAAIRMGEKFKLWRCSEVEAWENSRDHFVPEGRAKV